MAFNLLPRKGIPVEEQLRHGDELNVEPCDKDQVHPHTRTRIIRRNGIGQHIDCYRRNYRLETGERQLVEESRARETVGA